MEDQEVAPISPSRTKFIHLVFGLALFGLVAWMKNESDDALAKEPIQHTIIAFAMTTPHPADICVGPYFYRNACDHQFNVAWPGIGPPGQIDGFGCSNHAIMAYGETGRQFYIVGQVSGTWPQPPQDTDPSAYEVWKQCYIDHSFPPRFAGCNSTPPGGVQNPTLVPLDHVHGDPSAESVHRTWCQAYGCTTIDCGGASTPPPSATKTVTPNRTATQVPTRAGTPTRTPTAGPCYPGAPCPRTATPSPTRTVVPPTGSPTSTPVPRTPVQGRTVVPPSTTPPVPRTVPPRPTVPVPQPTLPAPPAASPTTTATAVSSPTASAPSAAASQTPTLPAKSGNGCGGPAAVTLGTVVAVVAVVSRRRLTSRPK